MITEMEKELIRQHLGYPMLTLSGGFLGQGDIERVALLNCRLEEKLNNITPISESIITGAACGMMAVMSDNATSADDVMVTISGEWLDSEIAVTATTVIGDTPATVCARIVQALSRSAALQAKNFYAYGPFPGGAIGFPGPTPQIGIRAPKAFTMTVESEGSTTVTVTMQGQLPLDPVMTAGSKLGEPIILYGYLPILNWLNGARAGATRNADTVKAGEWVRGNERKLRNQLYQDWRLTFASKLGVELYEGFNGPSCNFVL